MIFPEAIVLTGRFILGGEKSVLINLSIPYTEQIITSTEESKVDQMMDRWTDGWMDR